MRRKSSNFGRDGRKRSLQNPNTSNHIPLPRSGPMPMAQPSPGPEELPHLVEQSQSPDSSFGSPEPVKLVHGDFPEEVDGLERVEVDVRLAMFYIPKSRQSLYHQRCEAFKSELMEHLQPALPLYDDLCRINFSTATDSQLSELTSLNNRTLGDPIFNTKLNQFIPLRQQLIEKLDRESIALEIAQQYCFRGKYAYIDFCEGMKIRLHNRANLLFNIASSDVQEFDSFKSQLANFGFSDIVEVITNLKNSSTSKDSYRALQNFRDILFNSAEFINENVCNNLVNLSFNTVFSLLKKAKKMFNFDHAEKGQSPLYVFLEDMFIRRSRLINSVCCLYSSFSHAPSYSLKRNDFPFQDDPYLSKLCSLRAPKISFLRSGAPRLSGASGLVADLDDLGSLSITSDESSSDDDFKPAALLVRYGGTLYRARSQSAPAILMDEPGDCSPSPGYSQ